MLNSILIRSGFVAASLFGPGQLPFGVRAADLIVSANDAKFARVVGTDTFIPDAAPDTLTLLDASTFPPVVKATFDVAHAIFGPPQAVAITPNGKLAVVSAPSHYDAATKTAVSDSFLQIIDLENRSRPPRRIPLEAHPQGVAINRAGTLMLAATIGGTVAVLTIDGDEVKLNAELKISNERLSGITFTHDGRSALVGLRDEQGLMVLDVKGREVTTQRERVTTGIGPYSLDVSSDGKWAVVSNAGLAALKNAGRLSGDADTFTLIDVSKKPFRAVEHVTVPSVPEGVAISPDARWIAVQCMDGSNLPADNPGRRPRGRVLFYEIKGGQTVKRGDLPGGEAAQGIVFTADSRHVLVQFNVEKQIAIYAVNDGAPSDTGRRIAMPGGPASIRTAPR